MLVLFLAFLWPILIAFTLKIKPDFMFSVFYELNLHMKLSHRKFWKNEVQGVFEKKQDCVCCAN